MAEIENIHCPISVSYTHLRAHETEADLVCRLLLEKKTPIFFVDAKRSEIAQEFQKHKS